MCNCEKKTPVVYSPKFTQVLQKDRLGRVIVVKVPIVKQQPLMIQNKKLAGKIKNIQQKRKYALEKLKQLIEEKKNNQSLEDQINNIIS